MNLIIESLFNENTFLKNPNTSVLGKKIVSKGIDLMDNIGFEQFTFKKLAAETETTEASIYRYFENKHKLLLYYTSWYWAWQEYRVSFGIANIESPYLRLENALLLITDEIKVDSTFSHINEVKLNNIVISEFSKTYLNKSVEDENRNGVFFNYKVIVSKISDIILEINPNYKYPHMLVSTVVEGAHIQRYFQQHLPKLSDKIEGEDSINTFYKELVLTAIKNSK